MDEAGRGVQLGDYFGTRPVVLASLGDLLEDVVVRIDDPVNVATDTDAHITRRRGGSATVVASGPSRVSACASASGPASSFRIEDMARIVLTSWGSHGDLNPFLEESLKQGL